MIIRHALIWMLRVFAIMIGVIVFSWPLFWPDADMRGTWRSEGYGMVVEIGRFGVRGYQETPVSCQPFFSAPAHTLVIAEAAQVSLSLQDGRLSLKEEGTVNPIFADRIDALPESCQGDGTPAPDQATPGEIFDIAWSAMATHYPFFDLHGVDWQARHDQLSNVDRPADLWPAMIALLDGLDDGHIYLVDPVERRVFSPAERVPWADEAIAFREVVRTNQLGVISDTGLEYTVLDGNIGYVFLRHMGVNPGFATTEADMAERAFETVADALRGTRAIILDNRLNPGGSDTVSLAYASFFAAEPVTAFSKETRTATGYTQPFTATVMPRLPALTQPVYLLNSGYTASAAEIFSMALQELDQVTIIGDATSGALSDIMEITLANGWLLGFSHQIYRDASGNSLETIGIQPDIDRAFDAESFRRGVDSTLDAVVGMITN